MRIITQLRDLQDDQIVWTEEGTRNLGEMVALYIEDQGYLDTEYFNDGEESLTGREYLDRGDFSEDFELAEP